MSRLDGRMDVRFFCCGDTKRKNRCGSLVGEPCICSRALKGETFFCCTDSAASGKNLFFGRCSLLCDTLETGDPLSEGGLVPPTVNFDFELAERDWP